MILSHATALAWPKPNKRRYGSDESYRIAADWLGTCREVADWGAGGCRFRDFLPPGVRYRAVDGTPQRGIGLVADLAGLQDPCEGILLRHVVDNTFDPMAVLLAALKSFGRRLAVVTYTPDADASHIALLQDGWPTWHLNPDDLRLQMGALRKAETMTGAGPERVYLLERP